MAQSLLNRLKDVITRRQVAREEEKSVEWLKGRLQNFAVYSQKEDPSKTLKRRGLKNQSASMIDSAAVGRMIMFYYDAKHKDTLPFWDRFPLVIPIGPAEKGFYGANLHYLPPALRARFFDALLDTLSNETITENSRLNITYNLLKSTQKYKYFKPCFKHYLISNVKSQVKLVPADDWWRVIFLQNAQWQKASQATVYKWSRDQIR